MQSSLASKSIRKFVLRNLSRFHRFNHLTRALPQNTQSGSFFWQFPNLMLGAAGVGSLVGINGVLLYQILHGTDSRSLKSFIDQLRHSVGDLRQETRDFTRAVPAPLPDFVVENVVQEKKFEQLLRQADYLLSTVSDEDKGIAYRMLRDVYETHKDNHEFLWRLAQAACQYGNSFINTDHNARKQLVFEAKVHAFTAHAINPDHPNVQKWCAMTTGTASEYLSINDKIKGGWHFKAHIDRALQLSPNDPSLHHYSGRWCYGVAALTWIERKIAAALFTTPPSSTYDEALDAFLQVERLDEESWKENRLYIAKCYLAKGLQAEAAEWLRKAYRAPANGQADVAAQHEIQLLANRLGTSLAP